MNIKKEKNKKEGNKSLNPKGFWNEFENYIINKILDNIEIDKNIIQRILEEIAFFEIKNGNYVFSERNLRESEKVNINQKILDICIKENIISQSGQWLHFISKDLQIYLAIYLEKINTNSRRDICITFIKEFEIETEINENFEPEGSSSCILDVARN